MATMVVDHVGAVIGNRELETTTLVGRLAFPLFAWLVATHAVHHTRDPRRYLFRLVILALVSQIPFELALGDPAHPRANIVFTLGLGLLALQIGRTDRRAIAVGLALGLAWIATRWFDQDLVDYGPGGILLLFLLGRHHLAPGRVVSVATLAVLACLNLDGVATWPRALATLAVIPVLHLVPAGWTAIWVRRAHLGWYAFYPVHLLGLWLVHRVGG